jgi:hypothetical protein
MSALQGFTNVLGRAADMSYRRDQAQNRRDQLDLYERNLELDEEKQAQENETRYANQALNMAEINSWLSKDGVTLGEKFAQDLKAGTPAANKFILNAMNEAGAVGDGGAVTNVTYDPTRDGFMATVKNADGSPGAITEGASNANDANVLFVSYDDVLERANTAHNISMSKQDVRRVAELRATHRAINTASDAMEFRQKVIQEGIDPLKHNKAVALLSLSEGNERREVAAIMDGRGVTKEEQVELITEIAKDKGVEDQLILVSEEDLTAPPEKDLLAAPVIGNETRLGDYLKREAEQRKRLNKGEINQGEFTKWQIENRGKKTQKPLSEIKDELARAEKLLAIKEKEGDRGPLGGGTRPIEEAQKRVDDLKRQLEPPQAPKQDKVIQSDVAPVQKEFDVAAALTEGKTADQIADMAIAGDIVLSPQATKEIATKLQQAGVQELTDIALLNRKDQALAWAVVAATVTPARANFFMEQVRNVMETGVSSTSAKDQADNEIRRGSLGNSIRNTNIRLQELSNARIDKAIGISEELIQNVRDTFTDSLDKETADAFMDGGTLNKMWVRRQQFPKGSEPRALIDQAINAAVSQIAASYAAEEGGGVWETLASFTRGDAEDNAGATDQFLNRVIISNGKVYYTTEPTVDPATGKIDRALLDQNFDLSDLKNKSPQVYTLLKRAAENNTKQLLAANG